MSVDDPEETVEARVKWQDYLTSTITSTLKSLQDTTPPDCCIVVGTGKIAAHKTALQLNSSLLISEDVSVNKETGIIEIQLVPEFVDHYEEVNAIVKSFYTGSIDISERNIKIIYKFCMCYSVFWLTEYLRPRLIAYLTADSDKICDRFVEIFRFAHTVSCVDLKDACIGILNDDFITLILERKSQHKLDYYCMKTILTSEKLSFAEEHLVEMVFSWYREDDEVKTCLHLEDLLQHIQFSLIPKTHYSDLLNRIMNSPHLSEDYAGKLFKTLQQLQRSGTESGINRRKPNTEVTNLVPQPPPECIKTALHLMSNDMESGEFRFFTVTEGVSLQTLLKVSTILDAECLTIVSNYADYIVSDLETAPSNSSFTFYDFLLLYNDFNKSTKLLLFAFKSLLKYEEGYHQIIYIDWSRISYQTIYDIVNNTPLVKFLTSRRFDGYDEDEVEWADSRFSGCTQVEMLLLWAEAHQNEKELRQLLNCICYRTIPKNYIDLILRPYAVNLLGNEIRLHCTSNHNHQNTPKADDMLVESAACVYLKEEEVLFKSDDDKDKVSMEVSTSFDRGDLTLSYERIRRIRQPGNRIKKKTWKGNKKFILFDGSEKPKFPQYPLFSSHLHPLALKEFVKECGNLKLMFFD